MRYRPPIYVLPLLVVGALLLDRLEGAVGSSSQEMESRSPDMASVLATPPVLETELVLDQTLRSPVLNMRSPISLRRGSVGYADSSVSLEFELGRPGYARVDIFDARGRRVRGLMSEVFNAGLHRRAWDGRNDEGERQAEGVYFARLESLGEVESLRLVLNRSPFGDEG